MNMNPLATSVGIIHSINSTSTTSIPNVTDTAIYSGVLPKGTYMASIKLFMDIPTATTWYVACQGLREQKNCPCAYTQLSGMVTSDGVSPISVNVYQTTGGTLTRPYDYDLVRFVQLSTEVVTNY